MHASAIEIPAPAAAAPPPVVGSGTVRRLSRLSSVEGPVLSVYLDLEPGRCETAPLRDGQLWALTAGLQRGVGAADLQRVRELLLALGPLAHGARGLALFSAGEGGVAETVALPCHVEDMAVVDTLAWLEPLAEMCTPGDLGVVAVGSRSTRLFRGCRRSLTEFAALPIRAAGRAEEAVALPGWPPAAEDRTAELARRLSTLLMRAHRRRPFEQLVLAAPPGVVEPLLPSLAAELRERIAGTLALDLARAPAEAVAREAALALERSRG